MRSLLVLWDEIFTFVNLLNQSASYVVSTTVRVVIFRVPHLFSRFQAFFVAFFLPPDVRSKTGDAYLFLAEFAICNKAVDSVDDVLDA